MRNLLNTFRKAIQAAPRGYSALDAELLEDRILMSAVPMIDPSMAIDDAASIGIDPFANALDCEVLSIEHQLITIDERVQADSFRKYIVLKINSAEDQSGSCSSSHNLPQGVSGYPSIFHQGRDEKPGCG